MDDLQVLNERVGALLARLEPAQRKQLARELSRTLRGSQAKRIKANQNPDGTPFEPRKPQHLRARKGSLRMFKRLQRAAFLKARGNPDDATVGFAGFANHIARVSQYGLRDSVNSRGLQYTYPERHLLGFTRQELATVEDAIISHLAK